MTNDRVLLLLLLIASPLAAQHRSRPQLSEADVGDITHLVMMEDRRTFDRAALGRLLASAQVEVRRRAVLTLGRLADPQGRELARAAAHDPDTAVAATALFAVGQLKDSGAVAWIDSVLTSRTTPLTVAREAAGALGKIKTAEARRSLAHFLETAPNGATMAPVVGEALLSIGRMPVRGDIAPIVRWSSSPDVEVRWRASWALFRPRDPVAVPYMLRLARDPSPLVRAWAMRGLSSARVDSSGTPRARATALLRAAVLDADRSVRTEAVRALGTYQDSASFDVLVKTLTAADSWMSVSAAEGLGRMTNRTADAVRALVPSAAPGKPRALRITAMQSLLALSPGDARPAAESLAHDRTATSHLAAIAAAGQLGSSNKGIAELFMNDADVEVREAAKRVLASYSARSDSSNSPPAPATRKIDTGRSEADYRRIVERWVVPSYEGKAPPVTRWETSRGVIEIELYPGDAPLSVDDLVRSVEAGAIDGVEFERVVPNFVDQQRGIRQTDILRDEVNRRRLTRGNLSWASAGLDTGIPGYTFGITPQPHNEGDFTSLGRVIRGLEAVDRMQLGDRVVKVTMLPASKSPRTPK